MVRLGFDEHENGALVWRRPTALLVSAVGAAVLAVGLLLPEAAAIPVTALGAVAIFVALAGWLASAVELRYAGLPAAQPARSARTDGPRRRSLRRRSGIAYAVAAVGSSFAWPAILYRGTDDWAEHLLLLPAAVVVIAACFLLGPAARFVVTPEHLHLDTAFRRISVPRHLIGTFERSATDVRLRLTDRDFYDVAVDSPLWDLSGAGHWRLNSRCQVRTTRRIVAMLHEVPVAPAPAPGAGVVAGLRPGMIAFTVAAVLAAVAPLVVAL